jgi:hypothetical protein
MGCSDGHYYVVKFTNNPQGIRTLVNELLCARLASSLGLPVPYAAVIAVGDDLIERSPEMYVELERGRTPCKAGPCFGSRYPEPQSVIFDTWPRRRLEDVENIYDFAGMLVFDTWVSNTDFRQVRFARAAPKGNYRVTMFDNGDAFCRNEWRFRDKPRLAVNPCTYFYEGIAGLDAFEPWLSKLEIGIDEAALRGPTDGIPPEWYHYDREALNQLLEQLYQRRTRVRNLILALQASSPGIFANWGHKVSQRCVAAN